MFILALYHFFFPKASATGHCQRDDFGLDTLFLSFYEMFLLKLQLIPFKIPVRSFWIRTLICSCTHDLFSQKRCEGHTQH